MTGKFQGVCVAIGGLLLTLCAGASTGDFYPSYQAKLVGHLALSGKPTRQMLTQQEGRKSYLYVQLASQPGFTVVDVTKPARPRVVNQIPQQDLTMVNSGIAISETPDHSATLRPASQVDSGPASSKVPEKVRVLDVSDPAHPRTVQTFDGVTSILRDNARSLIYVANGDGIWILSDKPVLRRHPCSSSDAISSGIPNCD